MQNLRDKLLKAGLVSQDDAKKAEADKSQPRAPRPHDDPARRALKRPQSGPPPRERPPEHRARPPLAREEAIPKLPPLPGSKAHQRLEALKQRELDDKLRELVLRTQVSLELGARPFHFVTRRGRLRRLTLSDAQATLLEEGKLAVVERQEPAQIEHSLVPVETAEKMMALSPKAVRFLNKEGAPIGFLTDAELKEQQTAEASAGPEAAEPQVSVPDAEPEADAEGKETWIAIKRSPASS